MNDTRNTRRIPGPSKIVLLFGLLSAASLMILGGAVYSFTNSQPTEEIAKNSGTQIAGAEVISAATEKPSTEAVPPADDDSLVEAEDISTATVKPSTETADDESLVEAKVLPDTTVKIVEVGSGNHQADDTMNPTSKATSSESSPRFANLFEYAKKAADLLAKNLFTEKDDDFDFDVDTDSDVAQSPSAEVVPEGREFLDSGSDDEERVQTTDDTKESAANLSITTTDIEHKKEDGSLGSNETSENNDSKDLDSEIEDVNVSGSDSEKIFHDAQEPPTTEILEEKPTTDNIDYQVLKDPKTLLEQDKPQVGGPPNTETSENINQVPKNEETTNHLIAQPVEDINILTTEKLFNQENNKGVLIGVNLGTNKLNHDLLQDEKLLSEFFYPVSRIEMVAKDLEKEHVYIINADRTLDPETLRKLRKNIVSLFNEPKIGVQAIVSPTDFKEQLILAIQRKELGADPYFALDSRSEGYLPNSLVGSAVYAASFPLKAHIFQVGNDWQRPPCREDLLTWTTNVFRHEIDEYEVIIKCPVALEEKFISKVAAKVVEIVKSESESEFELNKAWSKFLQEETKGWSNFRWFGKLGIFGNILPNAKIIVSIPPPEKNQD